MCMHLKVSPLTNSLFYEKLLLLLRCTSCLCHTSRRQPLAKAPPSRKRCCHVEKKLRKIPAPMELASPATRKPHRGHQSGVWPWLSMSFSILTFPRGPYIENRKQLEGSSTNWRVLNPLFIHHSHGAVVRHIEHSSGRGLVPKLFFDPSLRTPSREGKSCWSSVNEKWVNFTGQLVGFSSRGSSPFPPYWSPLGPKPVPYPSHISGMWGSDRDFK